MSKTSKTKGLGFVFFFTGMVAVLLTLFFLSSTRQTNTVNPAQMNQLEGVRVFEHLGETVNLETPFVDENGQTVALQDFVKGERPLVVMMGYYECPKLCSLVLNGFFSAARAITWSFGNEYDFVMVSVDPKEDHILAANKKASYLRYYGRNGAEKGIHFLTGKEENIRKIADSLGFHYKYDDKIKQFVHPAVLSVLSPKGKITRYLYGIDFRANDVKLALLEGAEGRIGNIVERILLFCYQYDPHAGSYSVTVMSMMKVGALGTMIMIAFLVWFLRRQNRLKGLAL
jgi:protein SCO1/2